ncbi:hypothetical protein QJQ45_000969 [Haematococcus lacustris]|nr:hypothetical protein QJQ45_000969 [Haematococcus lacustris]
MWVPELGINKVSLRNVMVAQHLARGGNPAVTLCHFCDETVTADGRVVPTKACTEVQHDLGFMAHGLGDLSPGSTLQPRHLTVHCIEPSDINFSRLDEVRQVLMHHAAHRPGVKFGGPLTHITSGGVGATWLMHNVAAEVQRLRDVEQSLMGTVDGLQGDLGDLQAAHQSLQGEHTALQQVACRAAATNHSLRAARHRLQGQVHIYRNKHRPHRSPLTFKQRQQLLVLEQHPVSVEVLRRCAEAGYGRLDSHGRPMGSMAEQLSPAPSPTDIFIPTQESPMGRPAARTAPYNAHHCLSTVRLHLETGVSRRALSKCRQFFVSEQCVLPNPHRPGKTSTVGREFHVCTHIRGKLAAAAPPQLQLTPAGTTPELAEPAGAPPQQQQQLAAASTSRKRGAPAANKSRAAKQGATHNSVAKRASAARLACGEIA